VKPEIALKHYALAYQDWKELKLFYFNFDRDCIFAEDVHDLKVLLRGPCSINNGVPQYTQDCVYSLIMGGSFDSLWDPAFEVLGNFKNLNFLLLECQSFSSRDPYTDAGRSWERLFERHLKKPHRGLQVKFLDMEDLEKKFESRKDGKPFKKKT